MIVIVRAVLANVHMVMGCLCGMQGIVGMRLAMGVLMRMRVFVCVDMAVWMGVHEIAMPMLMRMDMSVRMLMDVLMWMAMLMVVGVTVIAVMHGAGS
jgi:hypothetical protein